MTWWYILIWTAVFIVNGRITLWVYHWSNEHQEKRFLKALRVKHPESSFTLISVSTRDDVALRKLKAQLRELDQS